MFYIDQIQDHLDTLQQQYRDSVNQRESLKQHRITTGLRLKRASILIDALGGEKVCIQGNIQPNLIAWYFAQWVNIRLGKFFS